MTHQAIALNQTELLAIGDRLWNGATVTQYLAEAYNSINETIGQFEREGRTPPENLLNGRHNLIANALRV